MLVCFLGKVSIKIVEFLSAAYGAILDRPSLKYFNAYSGKTFIAFLCFGEPNTRIPPPNSPVISTNLRK